MVSVKFGWLEFLETGNQQNHLKIVSGTGPQYFRGNSLHSPNPVPLPPEVIARNWYQREHKTRLPLPTQSVQRYPCPQTSHWVDSPIFERLPLYTPSTSHHMSVSCLVDSKLQGIPHNNSSSHLIYPSSSFCSKNYQDQSADVESATCWRVPLLSHSP